MKIGIIGAGYVGLTTGICLASLKHEISIFDLDEEKIKQINNKKLPFFEKRLQEILEDTIDSKNLITTRNLNQLVNSTEGCFICVGTPTKNDSIDLSQITNAVESLASAIKHENKNEYTIIIRSTIVPNTTKNVILPILSKKFDLGSTDQNIRLAVTPEFLRVGNGFDDFMNPDKIVIGSDDDVTKRFVRKIFSAFEDKC